METIFTSPALDENDARISWVHTDHDEETLVETSLFHVFEPQSNDQQEWTTI